MRPIFSHVAILLLLVLLVPAGLVADEEKDPLFTPESAKSKAAKAKEKKAAEQPGDKESSEKDGRKQKDKQAGSKEKKPSGKKLRLASILIKGALPEAPGPAGLFGELQRNLRETLSRLDKAATDDDISAVVLRLRNPGIGWGKIAEIRAAIERTRKAGKKVYAQIEMGTTADYLIGCACDEIIMPPSGMLLVPGVRMEVLYYKQLLDKVGIKGDFLHVGSSKGAAEPFTRTEMSDAVRENLGAVVDDYYEQMVAIVAKSRKLDPEVVKLLIDQGLFPASQAAKVGLIDRVAYEDDLEDVLKKQLRGESVTLVKDYGKKKMDTDFSGPMGFFKLMQLMMGINAQRQSSSEKTIAIVYATGPIMTGKSDSDLLGSQTMGSDTIVAALRKAEENEGVVAIVLRVDSPGGSALASDLIWREVVRIEKPIVVSMGDVAASGGYYISMGADKIYAEPGTLTGSIGVVGGKLALQGMFEKLGLNTTVIARGLNSGIFASSDPFSNSERKVFKSMMEDTYEQFTSKAAEGRGMKVEKLKKLAGGQVWTGQMAKQNGLVDELGTLSDALQAAKQLSGLSPDAETETLILPRPRSFFDELFGGPEASAGSHLGELIKSKGGQLTRLWQQALLLDRIFEQPVAVILPFDLQMR